jgi:hypothetical protein
MLISVLVRSLTEQLTAMGLSFGGESVFSGKSAKKMSLVHEHLKA